MPEICSNIWNEYSSKHYLIIIRKVFQYLYLFSIEKLQHLLERSDDSAVLTLGYDVTIGVVKGYAVFTLIAWYTIVNDEVLTRIVLIECCDGCSTYCQGHDGVLSTYSRCPGRGW